MPRSLAPQVASAINRRGALITLRTVTPAPAGPIPPILTAPVMGAFKAAGSTLLSINCGTASGVLSVGDCIGVLGQTVVVTAPIRARALAQGITPGWDNVPVSPALTSDNPVGTALSFSWLADARLRAIIGSFSLRVIDGDLIQARDLRITIAAYQNPVPNPATQKIVMPNGDVRSIVNVIPVYGAAGEIVEYTIQAR